MPKAQDRRRKCRRYQYVPAVLRPAHRG